MQQLLDFFDALLGLDASSLTIAQMCVRAVIVYGAALIMVRVVGDRRFAGQYAAIDIILGITFGATLSRAINGSPEFLPTLFASTTLVGLHWLLAMLTANFPQLEAVAKGHPQTLIEDGQVKGSTLKAAHLTRRDLKTILRQASLKEPEQVDLAVLEPGGSVSIIARSQAQVIEVPVEEGVKTVRIIIDS